MRTTMLMLLMSELFGEAKYLNLFQKNIVRYVHRVEVPELLQERGRFAAHASIADSFIPVQRKPNIVIGAANSRI